MNNVRQTSMLAWFDEVKPNLSKRQSVVLDCIKQHPNLSIRDYASILNVPSHVISGRFGELEKKQQINATGVKYFSDSNRPHTTWNLKK